ncbi:hypothetical protein GCM10010266_50730 [Streptomyces griseomycini]|nr:hypothetical protein [Streptomyces griseomycini]GGQ21503.1 hypothetical protein GCM10010266_50730 [Streptomyces griseomycini]
MRDTARASTADRGERATGDRSDGRLLRIPPAPAGRSHDLATSRAHRIIRMGERQGIPVLADRAYGGADPG